VNFRSGAYFGGHLLAVALICLSLGGCEEPVRTLKVNIGDTLPPLPVQDLSGNSISLKPSPDKLLMINVWATWCGPCRHEMPSLQRLVNKLGEERLELIGLSVDTDAHVVREYLIENKINFLSYQDRDMSEVIGVLGVRVFPSTFFVRPDGTLVKVIEGWRNWETPEILEGIRELLPRLDSTQAHNQTLSQTLG